MGGGGQYDVIVNNIEPGLFLLFFVFGIIFLRSFCRYCVCKQNVLFALSPNTYKSVDPAEVKECVIYNGLPPGVALNYPLSLFGRETLNTMPSVNYGLGRSLVGFQVCLWAPSVCVWAVCVWAPSVYVRASSMCVGPKCVCVFGPQVCVCGPQVCVCVCVCGPTTDDF